VAALSNWRRFANGDVAAGYPGLTPRVRQSAKTCHYGRITKAGNPQARWFLTQAAQQVAQHPGPLGAFYRRLKAKKNHNIAVVATARKLVVIAHLMLKNRKPYRYAVPAITPDKLAGLRVAATGGATAQVRPPARADAKPTQGNAGA
jgi:transposase